MLDEDAKFLREVLFSVLPNIVYPDELREIVEREVDHNESIKAFAEDFKKMIDSETDMTRKTDKRIFLNEMRRMAKHRYGEEEVAKWF
ncbi:MAG: hypothetical protein ACK4GQ_00525 [Candidatus Hadarchaeales archaeon]